MIAMPQVLFFWVLGETSDRSLFLISQVVEELLPPDLVTDMIEACRSLATRLAEGEAAWSDPRPLRLSIQAPAPAAEPAAHEGIEEPDVAALIARQVSTRPEAKALMTGGRTLSYGDLDRLADREPAWQPAAAALTALRSGDGEGVAAAAREIGRLAGLGPDDRLLALSSPGSGLSFSEILGGLAAGAAVILPTPAERAPEALAALAARENVTVWSSAPAVLEAALDRAERSRRWKWKSLRRILLHGDRVPVGLPQRLRALGGDVQAFATWGTAGAPVAASGPLDGGEEAGSCPPLQATAGWRLHVLDRDLVPRPAWVPGDLYLGNAAETVEASALQPTGERARRLPDGRIELTGTEPAPPVEALGYGADPRRVEEALQRHPAVRHAVVAWRGPQRQLAAWLLLRSGKKPSDDQLRAHLRASLPEHLLPSTFVRLDELPLTPEGQVDRSALVIPTATPQRAEARWSARETELAGLWEEVLGQRPATREDDFFELGGNSLLATQLLGRVAERFGLKTPLASFLDRPTLGGLAELLERTRKEERPEWAERFPLRQANRLLGALRNRILPPTTSPDYGMRAFMLLWFSQFVSGVGTGLGSFALGVWIYRQHASATQYAMMPFLATCTGLLIGPLAGVLADRFDRRLLILFGDTGAAMMTCLMALALFTGQMRLWHVYIIIFFMVGFSALQGPAMAASISMLVPRRQLARMGGINQAAGAATALICPPLSGFLVPVIGYHGVILIDVTTFLFAFVVLLLVRLPRPVADREQRQRRSILGDLLFGWRYLQERMGLLHLLTLFAATNFCLGIVQVLLTPLLLSFASPTELGTVQAASVAGGLLGSLALGLWGGPRRRVLGTLLFMLLQAPILLLGGLQPSVALIAVATFVFTGLSPFVGGLSQAIWQSKVAHAVQGRVLAIRSFIGGAAAPVAFLMAGPLADRVFEPMMAPGGALAGTVGQIIGVGKGRGVGLLFMTLGLFLMLIVGLFSLSPRLRRVETEIPDAQNPQSPVNPETPLQPA